MEAGNWDAIHIIVCNLSEPGKASYAVTSTVMASIVIKSETIGRMELTGSTTTNAQEIVQVPENLSKTGQIDAETFHISNVGRLIEQNELKLRSDVCDHYVNKQRAITNTGRLLEHYMSKEE